MRRSRKRFTNAQYAEIEADFYASVRRESGDNDGEKQVMIEDFKRPWTEADVLALIGQCESIRREFKAGVMFEREPESKWIETLSKEVSALANTEGGELILGIGEDKRSRPRVATEVDGVPASIAPERLQQLIEGNVSPYLPGMRVHRVGLSRQPDRAVFVIQVPQVRHADRAALGGAPTVRFSSFRFRRGVPLTKLRMAAITTDPSLKPNICPIMKFDSG